MYLVRSAAGAPTAHRTPGAPEPPSQFVALRMANGIGGIAWYNAHCRQVAPPVCPYRYRQWAPGGGPGMAEVVFGCIHQVCGPGMNRKSAGTVCSRKWAGGGAFPPVLHVSNGVRPSRCRAASLEQTAQ